MGRDHLLGLWLYVRALWLSMLQLLKVVAEHVTAA